MLRRAHVLLHTKVNDPCPTAVIEAMACGLPVAYPASGGTVELVGDEAGIGVAASGRLRAGRAAGARGARGCRLGDPRRPRELRRASACEGGRAVRAHRLARAPRGDLRVARAPAPRPLSRPASVAAWNRARVPSRSASERTAPRPGRASIRAIVETG